MMVSDGGDRVLLTFLTCRFGVQILFPFPLLKTKLIGDYNRRCGANCSVCQYIRTLVNLRPNPSRKYGAE